MLKIKKLLLGMGIIFAVCKCYAFDEFVVNNIQVNGLQRIELGTVYSYLSIHNGDTITDAKADDIISKLYTSGFFKDVRLERHDNTLIINLVERPVIAELSITGDHAFDHDKLVKALNDNGLIAGRIFDQGVLNQAVLSLKSEYYNRGLYSVIIDAQVIPLTRNRVLLNIAVSEGLNAKIASIQFVGNQIFSDDELRGRMFLSTGNWLSWWYKDNQYSNDKLVADIDNVRAYYMNRGYINFKISSIQVQLSADKKSVYITVNVFEGDQYTLDKIDIAGETRSAPRAELLKLITLKPGQVVNQEQLNQNIDSLKTKLGDYGYAFASVNPIPTIDDKNKTVSYALFVDTGNKAYVRNINISGNDKTRDIVIRRELRQPEAGLYNAGKIKRSKERLNLLGYFEHVDVNTEAVPGSNNQTDLNVKVQEKNTGSFSGSVGYAQGQGILLSAGLSQSNLFGSGKLLSLNASTSAISQSIGFSFNDPYFRPNGTSLGYDVYFNRYTPSNLTNGSPYSTQTLGFRTKSSVPVSEYDRINFGVGVEQIQVTLVGNSVPLRFVQFNQEFGSTVFALPVSMGWVRNTTDSSLWPTRGAIFSQTIDGTLPELGPQYYRFTSNNSWYVPVTDSFTWKTTGMLGYISAYGDSQVPFYQHYYMGGINSLRGYYINTLGPHDTDGSAIGGTQQVMLSNDLLSPLPGLSENRSVRMSLFLDMGTLWGGDSFGVTPQQEFRASYGVSMTWFSPLGPMKFSYGVPLYNQPNDILEPFQFMLGTSF